MKISQPYKKALSLAALVVPGVLFAVMTIKACRGQSLPPLPEGNTGIAALYPRDAGIAADSNVIFTDDFESYASASGLSAKWNGGIYHNVSIVTDSQNVYAGRQSLQFWSPQQTQELSNGVGRSLSKSEELDILFLRYYTKFDAGFDISGSSHNGGGMSSYYFVNGNATPGIPADGTNKFLAEFECWRGEVTDPSPGDWNVYIYHPEQRTQWGDHWFPDGTVMPYTYLPGDFGDEFVARPKLVPELGRWYCCEFMMKANTVGLRDGRVACWLDGVLIADFHNVRLRDIDTLKINRFNLSLHSGSNPRGETWKWYDNVVVATSYIGPVSYPVSVPHGLNVGKSPNHSLGPVVSGTTVSWELARPSSVTVDIYTLSGQIVGKLADRVFTAGRHRLTWDCRNRGTRPVADGIYVARIRTAGHTVTKKMQVIR